MQKWQQVLKEEKQSFQTCFLTRCFFLLATLKFGWSVRTAPDWLHQKLLSVRITQSRKPDTNILQGRDVPLSPAPCTVSRVSVWPLYSSPSIEALRSTETMAHWNTLDYALQVCHTSTSTFNLPYPAPAPVTHTSRWASETRSEHCYGEPSVCRPVQSIFQLITGGQWWSVDHSWRQLAPSLAPAVRPY